MQMFFFVKKDANVNGEIANVNVDCTHFSCYIIRLLPPFFHFHFLQLFGIWCCSIGERLQICKGKWYDCKCECSYIVNVVNGESANKVNGKIAKMQIPFHTFRLIYNLSPSPSLQHFHFPFYLFRKPD